MVVMERPWKDDRDLEQQITLALNPRSTPAGIEKIIHERQYVSYAEFDRLKERFENALAIIAELDAIALDHESKIALLQSVVKKTTAPDNLKTLSDSNVKTIRRMFNLPEIDVVSEDVLSQMRGMWKEYYEEGTDSVELLRSIRDE